MGFVLKEAKGKKITIRFKLFVLIIMVLLIYAFHQYILESIGSYLIVQDYQTNYADVILLEEENSLQKSIELCNSLYYEKGCKEVWMIRLPYKKNIISEERFEKTIREALDSAGYKFKFRFFPFYIDHPYTLNKSLFIADSLKKYSYKKVLILTEAFHSRRTYNVYKKILCPEGIEVFCSVYFGEKTASDWWYSANGFRNVTTEYMKLIFYWIKGYI